MSLVCVSVFVNLIISAVQTFRLKLPWVNFLIVVLLLELLYASSMKYILASFFDDSFSAASGPSNGGLTIQLILLFPLWAPVIAILAKRKLESVGEAI